MDDAETLRYFLRIQHFPKRRQGKRQRSGSASKKKYQSRVVANALQTKSFESLAIEIFHVDGTKSILVSVYKKPNSNFDQNEWDNLLLSLPSSRRIILGGDFNCHNVKWRSNHTSANGAKLEDWADEHQFSIFSSRFPTRKDAFLDLFLAKGDIQFIDSQRCLSTIAFASDHNIIVANCKLKAKPMSSGERVVYDWKGADLPKFTAILESLSEDMNVAETANMNIEEVEMGLSCLNTAFVCAMDEAVTSKKVNPKYEANVSPETLHLITTLRSWRSDSLYLQKRNALGQFSAMIAELNPKINRLAKIVREKVDIDRQTEFAERCKKIKNGNNMFADLKKSVQLWKASATS